MQLRTESLDAVDPFSRTFDVRQVRPGLKPFTCPAIVRGLKPAPTPNG